MMWRRAAARVAAVGAWAAVAHAGCAGDLGGPMGGVAADAAAADDADDADDAAVADAATPDAAVADAATPDAAAAVEIAWLAPAPGSRHVRAELDPMGTLAAAVDAAVLARGAARVELAADDQLALAGDGEELRGLVWLASDGPHTLRAVAYAASGEVAATAELAIEIAAPSPADCYAWLDLYRLDYRRGPDRPGVAAPVTLTPPINGVRYRYVSNEQPRATMFMDCELALSLARAAPPMRRRGVVELADIGVYNYRCIGGEGTPPDCPRGMSQHAYALALDIAGFTTDDGAFYSVNDDWVIDPAAEPTCVAVSETASDAFLHELICEIKTNEVWNIVLTPNYNAAHRNHFHVDLTEGSDFIRLVDDHTADCGGLGPEQ